METLLQGILSNLGAQGIEKIGKLAGLDSAMTQKILEHAGSLLMAKMADNTKTRQGRRSLEQALSKHDGSIFERLDDLVNPNVDTKGSKILGHILGSHADVLAPTLSRKVGAQTGQTQQVLEMIAPLVLGQLGVQKKIQNLDGKGLANILHKEKKSGSSMILDLAEQFLDKNKDGSIIDDVLRMAGNFISNK